MESTPTKTLENLLNGPRTPEQILRTRLVEAELRAGAGNASFADYDLLQRNLSPEEFAKIPGPRPSIAAFRIGATTPDEMALFAEELESIPF